RQADPRRPLFAAASARGKERAAWICLSAGACGWALGETFWAYRALVGGEKPFPSWADAGFATFLLGAALCLGFLLLAHPVEVQLRLALDGLIVGAALFGAAWVTLLDPVYAARVSSPAATALALAYPTVDIALIAMAALMLIRAPVARRPALAALTAGLVLITLSDTAFAYLTGVGAVHGTHVIAIGWAWGFLCLGIAALVTRTARSAAVHPAQSAARAALWLPYMAVVVSAAICTPVLFGGLGPVYVAAVLTVFA
ncbi:hypothetical protein C6A85_87470, partial [Mycobacterium sp. ITM-2017-0098]